MENNWKVGRLNDHLGLLLMFVLATAYLKLDPCCCMNEEGLALLRLRDRIESDPLGALTSWHEEEGEVDPCSWRGVECSDGKVVILDWKNLCLGGTLGPEIGNLVHIKAIILRNNTLSGTIPEQLGDLKELEVLDLGSNNFTGPLPDKLGNNYSSATLLLDNNPLLSALYPEIHEFEIMTLSEVNELCATGLSYNTRSTTSRKEYLTEDTLQRRLLASEAPSYLRSENANRQHPSSSPAPVPPINEPKITPVPTSAPAPPTEPSHFSPVAEPSDSPKLKSPNIGLKLGLGIGAFTVFFILILGIYCYKRHKLITVRPWATGLSGQLQKAFVTGVPKLKRSELETACEDFSNVIGSSSIGTIYKGTLSSGVEIAVSSVASKTAVDWSNNLESQFRKKIKILSKVNHKNFVNLIGYCEEEEPFTRMMVFEYAPNGTLFEHLHIEEAEHLDWGMRLRIVMGMAYCLEHMHQLDPAIPHKNLTSSAITLTEDYAAKVSDFSFWNQIAAAAADTESQGVIDVIETTCKVSLPHNVYSFGVLLFEMVTARLPYSVDNGNSLEDWASDYVREERPLRQVVDPTLSCFDVNQVDGIEGVIRCCVQPNPVDRPKIKEVCQRLRGITGIPNDVAAPRISPLWWAELEILSTEAN